jgi:hypothetical protein
LPAEIVLVAVMVTALIGLSAPAVRADGDPASDVLATQALFLPWDAEVPVARQEQLSTLLGLAERSGHPVRIAVIPSAADLGSVSALWRRPQAYAQFLAEELSLVYRGPLLVVMPNGFGLEHFGLTRPTVRSLLAGISVPHSGEELAGDALTALERLARASGHPLTGASAKRAARPHAIDGIAWIVFALGFVLIALAWTVSLRVQGLRGKGGKASTA